jgi:hypothetical protein
MKIYNQNRDLIKNYDKTQGKLQYKKTLIATYKKLEDIPNEYKKGYQINIEKDGFKVYACYGIFIPYTTKELETIKQKKYGSQVSDLLRTKYSLNAELAILRQKETKPEEFAEYNVYAEECKAKAKKLIMG